MKVKVYANFIHNLKQFIKLSGYDFDFDYDESMTHKTLKNKITKLK